MRKITINIFLFISILIVSCSTTNYITIDKVYEELTPPVTLVSRSSADYYGNRVYKVRDGNGRTYTCEDKSLSSVVPGTVIVPYKPNYEEIDNVLMKLDSPVIVIGKAGKYGQVLKVQDSKGKIVTLDDITLSNYQIGDKIK